MKTSDNTKSWWGCRKAGSLRHCGAEWYRCSGKQLGSFLKKKKKKVIYPMTQHGCPHKHLYTTINNWFCGEATRNWEKPTPPLKGECLYKLVQPHHGILLKNKVIHGCTPQCGWRAGTLPGEKKSQFQKVTFRTIPYILTFSKWQKYTDVEQISGCQELGVVGAGGRGVWL